MSYGKPDRAGGPLQDLQTLRNMSMPEALMCVYGGSPRELEARGKQIGKYMEAGPCWRPYWKQSRSSGRAAGRSCEWAEHLFFATWQRCKKQGHDETSDSIRAEAQPLENSCEDHGGTSLVRMRFGGEMRTELFELFSSASDETSP